MVATSNSVANQAIQMMGDGQQPVTGNAPTFDSSPAGIALSYLYTPAVQTVARQFGWDFQRNVVSLTTTGNTAPFPWSYEYTYPSNGIEVLQITPPSVTDLNNPLPVNWVVGNTMVTGVPTKVIWTNMASASAVISNQPGEALWDPLFRESVARLLASELAAALSGRPDTSRDNLEQASAFMHTGMTRDS